MMRYFPNSRNIRIFCLADLLSTPLRRLAFSTFAINVASSCILSGVITQRVMTFDWQGSAPIILMVASYILRGITLRFLAQKSFVSLLPIAIGHQIWTAFVVGAISMAAMGWQIPLVDPLLLRLDAALGFDAPSFAASVAAIPYAGAALAGVYGISLFSTLMLTCYFALKADAHGVMTVTFLSVLTFTLCGLIGVLAPAQGPLVLLGLPEEVARALPNGAGVYYRQAFEAYRNGAATFINLTRINGLVTFPSIHAVLALVGVYVTRGDRTVFAVISVLGGLTFISIFPIGGHYFTDAVGACLVFLFATWALRALGRDKAGSGARLGAAAVPQAADSGIMEGA